MERETVKKLPRLPQVGNGKQSRQRAAERVNKRVNSVIEAVEQMEKGKLDHESILEPRMGTKVVEVTNELSEKVMDIRETVTRRGLEDDSEITEREALERMTKVPCEEVSWCDELLTSVSRSCSGPPIKGEMAEVGENMKDIDLPDEGTIPKPASEISRTVRSWFAQPARMLREVTPELEKEIAHTPVYSDETFKKKSTLLPFMALMWLSGMLAFTREARSFVSMFCVVKKVEEILVGGLKTYRAVLRLVFDGRRGNLYWNKPPGMRLTTASQLGYL